MIKIYNPNIEDFKNSKGIHPNKKVWFVLEFIFKLINHSHFSLKDEYEKDGVLVSRPYYKQINYITNPKTASVDTYFGQRAFTIFVWKFGKKLI